MAILALDITGIPRQWISTETAITYWAKKQVAWYLGPVVARYRGGYQSNHHRSCLETTAIVAIRGHGFNPQKHCKVNISNRVLFGRDRYICAYCGGHFPNFRDLSRDHVVPRSRGGATSYQNLVTSCKTCNTKKSHRLLQEANMELLYVPYTPNHHEALILQNRVILADQMDYLISGLPKHSRVRMDYGTDKYTHGTERYQHSWH